MTHHYQQLITIFEQCFFHEYNTRLIRGEHEPIYLPADEKIQYHRIIFANGFYSSALHEIAHWCVAGKERRKLIDFGYWYCPDGRDTKTQKLFEQAETKPQALEWLFSDAAGFAFNVSCDNLDSNFAIDHSAFQFKVQQQKQLYLLNGMPLRAACFIRALKSFYQ